MGKLKETKVIIKEMIEANKLLFWPLTSHTNKSNAMKIK
jgi:hypothetical protein